jgi:RNA polymerase sigma-70 factor (ECF subfamily)
MSQSSIDFEFVVDRYYAAVFRFALSLARQPAEAWDLTQETFACYAQKRAAVCDSSRVKSWLMTTLFREFNRRRRHALRFPHEELGAVEEELPGVASEAIESLDGQTVMQALQEMEDAFRAPLALFYLEDYSYHEIAEILGAPIGTVMSRLSRGKAQLRAKLADRCHATPTAGQVVPLPGPAA